MDSRSAIISLKNQTNIKGTVPKDLWGLFYFKFVDTVHFLRKDDSERISSKSTGQCSLGFTKKQTRTEISKTGSFR
jgi:hypothetical protein